MNDFVAILRRLWKDLPNSRRISFVTTLVLAIAVTAGVVLLASRPKLGLLFGAMDAAEAAKVVEYLQSKRIPYELSQGGNAVLAPANKIYELRLELAAQGIPRTSDVGGGVGFELFDKPSFGMSDFMQRANYLRAVQGELARTIKQMEEVQDARVIMVAPEERLFGRDRREAKASVFVRLKAGRSLSQSQVEAIRFLVANAVEGMQTHRVAVVDSSGRALAEDQQANSLASMASGQLNLITRTEHNLTDKAQSMLDQVLGPGQSVLRVTVDMNFDAVQETSERFDPKGAVVRTETTSSESSSSTSESTGGTTGVASNTSLNKDEGSSNGGQKNEQKRENTTNQYEINKVVETRQRAVGSIKRLSIAVFVNLRTTVPEGGGEPTKNPRTPQDLKAIEDIVKEAVGFSQNETRQDSIRVQEVEFADWASKTPTEPQAPPVLNHLNRWLPLATQGALGLLAISVLFYLRSLLKQSAQTGASAAAVFDDLIRDYEEAAARNAQNSASARNASALTIEELGKIIRENPSNTAQAMKQWISRN